MPLRPSRRWGGKHRTRVFVRNGRPIESWNNEQWQRSCERAGIENVRFHDVRCTLVNWHVRAGKPLARS